MSAGSCRVVCNALHAARELAPNEEVTFHYGRMYESVRMRKGYSAGKAAHLLKADVPSNETPAAVCYRVWYSL